MLSSAAATLASSPTAITISAPRGGRSPVGRVRHRRDSIRTWARAYATVRRQANGSRRSLGRTYAEAGSGRPACAPAHPRDGGQLRELAGGDRARSAAPHRDRPRPSRPRPLRAGGRRLLARISGRRALRDLLLTLGHERATLVGHSLGGGIAMQFAYQFPEMVERLVLVSSGGLGQRSASILRAAALPGADLFIAATAGVGQRAGSAARRRRLGRSACSPAPMSPSRARLRLAGRARAPRGLPRHPALRRRHRAASASPPAIGSIWPTPCRTLIVWGVARLDHPGRARRAAHETLPGSRLEIFDGVGHLPQLEAPERFVAVLERFLDRDRAGPIRSRGVAGATQEGMTASRS